MASYVCEKCNKKFRGKYDLNRHCLRKFPCVKEKIPIEEKNEENKEKVVIFGNEEIEETSINLENEENSYILAVKLIINFHKILSKDILNIWLPSINSTIGNIITKNGKEILSIHNIIDIFLKIRSYQLLFFLEDIEENEENKLLKHNLENFMLKGILHKDTRTNTSNMKIMIKIALLKNKLK